MKSNIDKVYSKLPNKKHNFRKHKVDLSKLDDYKKEFEEIESEVSELVGIIEEVEVLRNEFNRKFDITSAKEKDLNERYNELFKALSDLGADDLATQAFEDSNKLANMYYNQDWDSETLKFFRR